MSDYICIPRWLLLLPIYILAVGGLLTLIVTIYNVIITKVGSRL